MRRVASPSPPLRFCVAHLQHPHLAATAVAARAAFRPQFSAFGEYVDLGRHNWRQLNSGQVLPGEHLLAEVQYTSSNGTAGQAGYAVTISGLAGEMIADGFLPLQPGDPLLSDAYVAMENVPADCQEMPSCENLNIRNITLEWDASGGDGGNSGGAAPSWSWAVHNLTATCKPAIVVHGADHLEFVWSISPSDEDEAARHRVDEL